MAEINFMEVAEQYSKRLISDKDDKVKKAEAIIAELASTEDGRQELAEIIGIYIDRKFNTFDIAPYLFYYKNFRLGETPEFRLKKKGIKAYWIAPNSSTPKSRNYMETLSMEFDSLSVRPECLQDEIKTGRLDTLISLLTDATDAMRNAIVGKVFTILSQTYTETKIPNQYAEDTTKLSDTTLKAAIAHIQQKTGTNGVVMGDSTLINQITEFTGFADEALEEIRKTGKIGIYRGATVMNFPGEVIDPVTNISLVPTDKIYVVGSKIGYAGTYGDSKSGQDSSIEDWSWNARIDKEWGAAITETKGLYVIKVV